MSVICWWSWIFKGTTDWKLFQRNTLKILSTDHTSKIILSTTAKFVVMNKKTVFCEGINVNIFMQKKKWTHSKMSFLEKKDNETSKNFCTLVSQKY